MAMAPSAANALTSSSSTYFDELELSLTVQNTLDSMDEHSLAEEDFGVQSGVPSFSQWLLPGNSSSGRVQIQPAIIVPQPPRPRPYIPNDLRDPSALSPDSTELPLVERWQPVLPELISSTPDSETIRQNTNTSSSLSRPATAPRFLSCEANSSFQTSAGRALFMSTGLSVSLFIVVVNTMIFIAFARQRSLRRVPGHTLIVYAL